jgi:hypothetical protein
MATQLDTSDRLVFDSGTVRIGAFRCNPEHPHFHDSGPARNYCFAFPRTVVQIQHEHERGFVANSNAVTVTIADRNIAATPSARAATSATGSVWTPWFATQVPGIPDRFRLKRYPRLSLQRRRETIRGLAPERRVRAT